MACITRAVLSSFLVGTPRFEPLFIHTPSSRPNQKIGDAIKRMLKKVDVVLLCHTDYETPFNPRPMNSEWREKFKSEDYDVVDMVSDSESD